MKQYPYQVDRRQLSPKTGGALDLLRVLARRVRFAAVIAYLHISAWLLLARADSTQRYLDGCKPDGLQQSLNVRLFTAGMNADIESAKALRDRARTVASLNRVPRAAAMNMGPALGLTAVIASCVLTFSTIAWVLS